MGQARRVGQLGEEFWAERMGLAVGGGAPGRMWVLAAAEALADPEVGATAVADRRACLAQVFDQPRPHNIENRLKERDVPLGVKGLGGRSRWATEAA